jgi:hypothetical protein
LRAARFVTTTLATAWAAACAGGNPGAGPPSSGDDVQSHFPPALRAEVRAPLRSEILASASARKGLYVGEFSAFEPILGYPQDNLRNKPPTCEVNGAQYVNGIGVDEEGNLIAADEENGSVFVFNGPGMCGGEFRYFTDPYGQPVDVASNNAKTATIAVANTVDNNGQAGSIAACTIAGACSNLTNPNMYEVAGVTMAKNGDCWASAVNSSGAATLTYFRKCAGAGRMARGFRNKHYGGLDIDASGNLVSLSGFDSTLYVYKGCDPRCTLVGGPFTLLPEVLFFKLNKASTELAAANFAQTQVDIYRYSRSRVNFEYFFNNGLGASSGDVEGVAYDPR